MKLRVTATFPEGLYFIIFITLSCNGVEHFDSKHSHYLMMMLLYYTPVLLARLSTFYFRSTDHRYHPLENFSLSSKSLKESDLSPMDNLKGYRKGRSNKVSLWYVALLINTRFRFFILE